LELCGTCPYECSTCNGPRPSCIICAGPLLTTRRNDNPPFCTCNGGYYDEGLLA